MKFLNKLLWAVILIACFSPLVNAQKKEVVVDKIVARVDNYIVLLSDLENAYQSVYENGETPGPDARCKLLEGLIMNKVLVAKAEIDSVIVDDSEVTATLMRRMRYFELQAGGADKLEQAFGKPLSQIREELRDQVAEQLIVERMQQTITADITVTPAEVRRYFNKIPKDSVPFLAGEAQVGQIVKNPDISDGQRQKARRELEELRARIINGEDFAVLAKEYSQDPGSKKQGGDLGWTERGQFAPEFEEAAMTMEIDELSAPIETDFGFHLIQLLDRRGNRFRTRHILIRSQSNDLDVDRAAGFLDSLRTEIMEKDLFFPNIAKEHSDDQQTKGSGGMFTDMNTGDTWVATDELDPIIFFTIDTMKLGQITKPLRFRTEDGQPAVRIIYYKGYKQPHFADFKQDYQKLYKATLNSKKEETLKKWIQSAKKEVYIDVDPKYMDCNVLKDF